MLFELLLLAATVACASWTITEAEMFRDLREKLKKWACRHPDSWLCGKLAYAPTCYYCTSHYVAGAFLLLYPVNIFSETRFGYLLTWLLVVAISTVYLTLFHIGRVFLRLLRGLADICELWRDERKRTNQAAPGTNGDAIPRYANAKKEVWRPAEDSFAGSTVGSKR